MEAITKGQNTRYIYTYPECMRVLGDRSLPRGSALVDCWTSALLDSCTFALLHFCTAALLHLCTVGRRRRRTARGIGQYGLARVGEIAGISTSSIQHFGQFPRHGN
jgi:hypothetical protein